MSTNDSQGSVNFRKALKRYEGKQDSRCKRETPDERIRNIRSLLGMMVLLDTKGIDSCKLAGEILSKAEE